LTIYWYAVVLLGSLAGLTAKVVQSWHRRGPSRPNPYLH